MYLTLTDVVRLNVY